MYLKHRKGLSGLTKSNKRNFQARINANKNRKDMKEKTIEMTTEPQHEYKATTDTSKVRC